MNPRNTRLVSRAIHLFAAIAISLLVYTPLADESWFVNMVRFGSYPAAAFTGLAIWLGPRWAATRSAG